MSHTAVTPKSLSTLSPTLAQTPSTPSASEPDWNLNSISNRKSLSSLTGFSNFPTLPSTLITKKKKKTVKWSSCSNQCRSDCPNGREGKKGRASKWTYEERARRKEDLAGRRKEKESWGESEKEAERKKKAEETQQIKSKQLKQEGLKSGAKHILS